MRYKRYKIYYAFKKKKCKITKMLNSVKFQKESPSSTGKIKATLK